VAKSPATKDNQAEFRAFQQVHSALLPLSPEQRGRLIASVTTLLATTETPLPAATASSPDARAWSTPTRSGRPMSLVELMKEKAPATRAGKITLFAYHREKNEGKPRFARGDLSGYFRLAHEPPPGNYDRDFIAAVKKGWLQEDGSESYITSKGIDEVESGFPNERKRVVKKKAAKPKAKVRKKPAR
jgi:hypothetical protein